MKSIKLYSSISLLILSPIIFYIIYFFNNPLSNNPSEWGSFGDYLAGTTGLLGGLIGLIIIIHTYIDQKNKDRKSDFENKLFRLWEFHIKLLENLQYGSDKSSYIGMPAIKHFAYALARTCNKSIEMELRKPINSNAIKEILIKNYTDVYSFEGFSVGHYFRNLYYIFRFIKNSDISDNDKTFYAKMIRAQLSIDETVLIGINGITEYGENFYPLIVEYSLLHRMMNANIFRAALITIYPSNAFGNEILNEPLPADPNSKWIYSNIKI